MASIDQSTHTAALYVNGQAFANSSSNILQGTWVSNSINNNPLFVGWRYAPDNDYPGSAWMGDISDLQIYDGALSQSDAESIYSTGVDAPEPTSIGLVAAGAMAMIAWRRRRPTA